MIAAVCFKSIKWEVIKSPDGSYHLPVQGAQLDFTQILSEG